MLLVLALSFWRSSSGSASGVPVRPPEAQVQRLRRSLPRWAFERRWRHAEAADATSTSRDAAEAQHDDIASIEQPQRDEAPRGWERSGSSAPAAASNSSTSFPSTSASNCPPNLRPYHVLLTASTGAYQLWQSRIFYYHYERVKREAGPCTEVGGFTRLLTRPKSMAADAWPTHLRTIVVDELTQAQTMGFVVLNRPHSVLTALQRGDLVFAEEYVFIGETDHLLMKPLPNLATRDEAVGYPFHYMEPTRDPRTIALVRRFAGSDAVAARVQRVGPSPLLIHQDGLRALAGECVRPRRRAHVHTGTTAKGSVSRRPDTRAFRTAYS